MHEKALTNAALVPAMSRFFQFIELVELGRIELPSESILTQTSPGADGYCGLSPVFLTIAQTVTRLQLGSFIMHGAGKAYRAHVLH